MTNLLSLVREDMAVYDRNDDRIGVVKAVQFGDEDLARPGVETATAQPLPEQQTGPSELIRDFARALSTDRDIPEEIRSRMRRYGYFRVDGLLKSARYVRADQIQEVGDERVDLNVDADELLTA